MKKTVIIDAFSLIYKAFFAVREMHTSSNIPTNAVYGFVNMLIKIIKDEQPDYIFAAFDCGPTFRHKEFDGYKAKRAAMPEELKSQIPYIEKILDSAGISVLKCDNYEADDIVGLVSKKTQADGNSALIITGDRDSFQLVDDNITVMYAKKGVSDTVPVDNAYIEETYQLKPKQLIDVKSLMGDASDNIPGVLGVGEKTAFSLIREYGSLDNVYHHIDDIKGKMQEKLLSGKESAYLSYDLARIRTDFDFSFDYENGDDFDLTKSACIDIFTELEMKNILKQLGVESNAKEPSSTMKFDNNIEYSLPSVDSFEEKTVVALLGKQKDDGNFIFCVANDEKTYVAEADNAYLKAFYENKQIKIVSHDFKQQYKLLTNVGVKANDLLLDTFIAAYLISATDERYDINTLVKKYLALTIPERNIIKQQSFFAAESDGEEELLADKARAVFLVKDVLSEEMEKENLTKLYREIEHRLIFVLADMENIGFKADMAVLNDLDRDFDAQKGALVTRIREITGYDENLNLNSSKQLAWLLYEDLELPVVKKTKGKTGYSTDNEALEKLKDKHEVVPLIIEYRQVAKLSSTYIKGMMHLTDENSRIHTTFNQTITTTGRISSSNPNLQNIPVRTPEGRQIRKVFISSDDDHVLVDADYSQIELRVLAHISGDENLCNAFLRGEDIHTRTAGEVFGVSLEDVTAEERSKAKAVNFGIVYGISDFGLAKNLNIKRSVAKDYIDRYLEKFPSVRNYMLDIVEFCRNNGFVETMFNRRRYIPEITSRNFNLRAFAERTALNTPVQGSAADIIKIAMVNVNEKLKEGGFASRLILQVHDELIIDCLKSELDDITKLLRNEMENAVELKVPLVADIKNGRSWYETK